MLRLDSYLGITSLLIYGVGERKILEALITYIKREINLEHGRSKTNSGYRAASPHHMFDLPPNHRTGVMEDYSFAKQFVVERRKGSGDIGSTMV
jgi:hypothetical protein